jgi:DNA-binding response OmpR family regulator
MAKKILIADDDRDFVDLLRERLEASGFTTVAAYEGIRTVEVAHKEQPDLILLDWKMPAGEGSSVLQALSVKDDTKHIPVIILTGVEERDIEDQANSFGVKDIITKPYDSHELIEKIQKALA